MGTKWVNLCLPSSLTHVHSNKNGKFTKNAIKKLHLKNVFSVKRKNLINLISFCCNDTCTFCTSLNRKSNRYLRLGMAKSIVRHMIMKQTNKLTTETTRTTKT